MTFKLFLWAGFNRAMMSPTKRKSEAVKKKYFVTANGPAEFIKAKAGVINLGQTDSSIFLYREK